MEAEIARLLPASRPVARRRAVALEIERAALGLFVQRGYRAVTVDEIVKAAGVSRRTFFRYFPEKYDVLLAEGRRRQQLIVVELERRSYERSTFAALCQAMLAAAHFDPSDLATRQLQARLVTTDPDLSERLLSDTELMGEQLCQLVADRLALDRREDCRADLLVRLARSAARTALWQWWNKECESDLFELMEATFELLEGRLVDEVAELDARAQDRRRAMKQTARRSGRNIAHMEP